jgi:hypothetical protein
MAPGQKKKKKKKTKKRKKKTKKMKKKKTKKKRKRKGRKKKKKKKRKKKKRKKKKRKKKTTTTIRITHPEGLGDRGRDVASRVDSREGDSVVANNIRVDGAGDRDLDVLIVRVGSGGDWERELGASLDDGDEGSKRDDGWGDIFWGGGSGREGKGR